jgi:hypothetical protein
VNGAILLSSGCLCVAALVAPPDAHAQVDGHVSVLVDVVPDVSEADGSLPAEAGSHAQGVIELRTRLFVERRQDAGEHVRFNLSGYVDGLLGDREATGGRGTTTDAIARPGDLFGEFRTARFDLRAGFSRLVWGRLDEFQPTDVVNPIDLTRFLLEGRSEARLPVALVSARIFLPHSSTLEAVVAPVFRASTFDQLEEGTSPFNALPRAATERDEPATSWSNVQGGGRLTATVGRVDWALSAYRGFRTFPTFSVSPLGILRQTFPRFTMIGADFETVRGAWGLRGEVAAFVADRLRSSIVPGDVPGRTIEGGVGADRRAGDYRVSASVLVTHMVTDDSPAGRLARFADPDLEGTDALIVGSADRSFSRDTRRVQAFAAYDPDDDSAFARVIGAISLRDNVWLEGSGGLFAGSSLGAAGRLTGRDFLYARLKVFF